MRSIKLKQWDKIEIDWLDSIQNTDGWMSPKEFSWEHHYKTLYHKLIGYYVNECKEAITICEAYALDNGEKFVGAWTVPKGCVTKIRKLK